jgi:hypothetical protein
LVTSVIPVSLLDWAAAPSGSRTVLGTEFGFWRRIWAMSDHIPAPGDAENQRGSESDLSHTAEFAKMRAVMRASEKHREGGVDPELEVADADPDPET